MSAPLPPHPELREYYGDAAGRRRWVDRLFDHTALRYDHISGLLDFGTGVRYRREALARAGIGSGHRVLDVATGTGQVARAASALTRPGGRVLGIDASFGMLRVARTHLAIPLVRGLAEELPLAEATLDALTMGYALRHVRDLVATFREYRRVLRPGGIVLLLELTPPRRGTLAYHLVRFHMGTLIPALAGRGESRTLMRYFWDTVDRCVPPAAILEALAEAGFESPGRHLSFGICSEYTARKPQPSPS